MRSRATAGARLGDVPHPRRFLIIGAEVILLGIACLVGTLLAFGLPTGAYGAHSLAWWFLIVGIAIVLVGMEAVAVARAMTARTPGDAN